MVYELEALLRSIIPRLPAARFRAAVQHAGHDLLRLGVTSFHDASAGNTLEDLTVFQQLAADGLLASRATVMIGSAALEQLLESRLGAVQRRRASPPGKCEDHAAREPGRPPSRPGGAQTAGLAGASTRLFSWPFHAVEEATIGPGARRG